eukprot:scaffold283622_cov51-Prasinocladus_malaysianus.AAC.1
MTPKKHTHCLTRAEIQHDYNAWPNNTTDLRFAPHRMSAFCKAHSCRCGPVAVYARRASLLASTVRRCCGLPLRPPNRKKLWRQFSLSASAARADRTYGYDTSPSRGV